MSRQIKFNVKMKLTMGFLLFFIISGAIPGIVSFFISALGLDWETVNFLIPVLTLSVSLIICVIVAMYLRKWITVPIKKLMTATEELAKGNLDVDLVVETGDEIESFSKSLARMESSLRIASDMLGPADIEKYRDTREIKGLGIGEKIALGLMLFLVLEPIVISIPIILWPETLLASPLASLIFTLILLIALVYYLNKSIMQPFAALTEAAERISKGDLDAKVEVRSTGDVGRLELNFKNIYERVQRAMKELGEDG